MSLRRARLLFLAIVVVFYGGAMALLHGLSFPVQRDELHFWPTTVGFSESFFPSVERLRGYNELNTPLPFVVFGMIEYAFHGGIVVARYGNALLSLAVAFLVGWPRSEQPPIPRLLALAGLLSCPYYLFVSFSFYTDMMAIFFTVLGLWLWIGCRVWPAALCFVLGISSRQYMVAFPIGLAALELHRSRFKRHVSIGRVIALCLAAASLAGWIWFFGGPAPPAAAVGQRLLTVQSGTVMISSALYFVACIGLYFVCVEFVLFKRWRGSTLSDWVSPASLTVAALVVVGFLLFPPLHNVNFAIPSMGYFDKALRLFLGDSARMAVLCAFGILTALRFHRLDLPSLLVGANVVTMLKAHVGWDKYTVPLLACLWLLSPLGGAGSRGLRLIGMGSDHKQAKGGKGHGEAGDPTERERGDGD